TRRARRTGVLPADTDARSPFSSRHGGPIVKGMTDTIPNQSNLAPVHRFPAVVSSETPPTVKTVEIIRRPSEQDDSLRIDVLTYATLAERMPALEALIANQRPAPLSIQPRWLNVLHDALGHEIYVIEAREGDRTVGFLPLAFVQSLIFGKYLVSLPYLNSNGVIAQSYTVKAAMIERAADLAEELGAKHLELRHESAVPHARLNVTVTSKVHMRLPLPKTAELLWKGFDPKVRNQIRKAEKSNFVMRWGGLDLLDSFYRVISRNMRDLGTPVYGRNLFSSILETFPGEAEIGLLETPDGQTVAAALLLHGPGITEVPTASSLREFNSTCANMLLYRHLLERAIGRNQAVFDFGRSTQDGPTFKFKNQWGALPHPAAWQYASPSGCVSDARPDNPKYQRMIQIWQKLPVWLTETIGPPIVRGIP
ncbi:MAG: FemAB family XrtA/PEP-CTERM system-associated protein, partial [Gemmataceae bacterium]